MMMPVAPAACAAVAFCTNVQLPRFTSATFPLSAAALTAAADGVHRHPPVAMPQPLAVLDLALSAGPVAHELGVARADCGRTGLRHSEERDPIPDGRLRGHGANAALL